MVDVPRETDMADRSVTLESKDGSVELTPQTLEALRLTWPTKDVRTELAKMHLWLLANPARRPANIWRFVRNWLKKAPDFVKPAPMVAAWWTTEARTLNMGESLEMKPRAGESLSEFRDRISTRIAERQATAH
jgi:hypothetical protein